MRWKDIDVNYGIYPKPSAAAKRSDGSASPLTFQGDKKWQDDPDFMHKWFSRPFLTSKKPGNYMLPIKKKSQR